MSILPGGAQLIRENVLSLHCGKVATTEEMLLATDKRKASSSHRTCWYWNAKRKQQSKPGNTTFSVIFSQWLVERFLSWFIARAHTGEGRGWFKMQGLKLHKRHNLLLLLSRLACLSHIINGSLSHSSHNKQQRSQNLQEYTVWSISFYIFQMKLKVRL